MARMAKGVFIGELLIFIWFWRGGAGAVVVSRWSSIRFVDGV
jgi:hypothetical protein